ncbi:MAG: flagellar motor protein MotD [Steroidobacteraceae bacterium]
MSRRHKHEEHANHESWAIPYGDLVTLLLAFFVVMYAISSVNEGKYRVVSQSLSAAFRGAPVVPLPIQMGERSATSLVPPVDQIERELEDGTDPQVLALQQMAQQLELAMSPLISQGMVDVHRGAGFVEVAIRSDLLFASGVAQLSQSAQPVIRLLGQTLSKFPNNIRVEGHTDNVPIRNAQFQSNWELSAGRAANVVHLLTESGVAPKRLSVLAFGEYRPVLPNTTADGRNANRRVVLTVVGSEPPPDQAGSPDPA